MFSVNKSHYSMPLYKMFRSYSGVKKEGCLYSLDWTTGLDY